MIALITPAKRLNTSPDLSKLHVKPGVPEFAEMSAGIITVMRRHSEKELGRLMHISPKLAALNHERYIDWQKSHNQNNSSPAALTFAGDVYQQFFPQKYSAAEQRYLQKHVYILSGLYGILRAYDLIQPYRLEMGIELGFAGSKHMGDYWQKTVTDFLLEQLKSHQNKTVLGLVSDEYATAIDVEQIPNYVRVVFLQNKKGKLENIGLLSKKARGMVVEHMVKHNAQSPDDIKSFSANGYRLHEQTKSKLVFVRDYQ